MRVVDRDLIRGGHYGQRSCENRFKRPNTWLHRPMLQNVKKALANTEPSTHGTKRTCSAVRLESASSGKAEVEFQGDRVAFDPNRALPQ
jgi:hypothetical protein